MNLSVIFGWFGATGRAAQPLAALAHGPAALALSAYCALWFVLLHVPPVLASGAVADRCSGLGENATLIVGGLLVYADVTVACVPRWIRPLPGARAVRLGRVLFAPAAFRMSRENLAHPRGNADFPPQWLAHRMGWGYRGGFGYIATGLAILWRTLPRLATVVAASMVSALTALCWVSFVLEAPGSRLTWTGPMIFSARTGAGWLVAESYREMPWRTPASSRTGFDRRQRAR